MIVATGFKCMFVVDFISLKNWNILSNEHHYIKSCICLLNSLENHQQVIKVYWLHCVRSSVQTREGEKMAREHTLTTITRLDY